MTPTVHSTEGRFHAVGTAPVGVDGARVTVVGAARSGLAGARLLAARGAKVFVTELGTMPESTASALAHAGVTWEDGAHTARALEADWLLLSPGVPTDRGFVLDAETAGLPTFSELEVAAWYCTAPVVAITGSNGKTTTATLTAHVFERSGRTTWLAGNVGRPFADVVSDVRAQDIVVLEVSSFQLDRTATFHPHVAVLLNITPDHLDRYGGDVEAYAQSKLRLARQLGPEDAMVYNRDDVRLADFADSLGPDGPRRLAISLNPSTPRAAASVRDGWLHVCLHERDEAIMPTEELVLKGRHNLYNSLAAAVAARVMEVRSDVVRESLSTFEGVPHRLESVREVDGVRYVNDSKATNVNAVWYALESLREPVVLLAGGRDKGNDYAPLAPLVADRVRVLISYGEAGPVIDSALGPWAERHMLADTLEEAVRLASSQAHEGDVVLLSPACASFDQFTNYEERGETFKRLVGNL